MAAKFLAGKTGRTQVGNSILALQEWSTAYHADPLDTTNFESNGHQEELVGVDGVDFTVKGNWDSNANPLTDPPGLYPRDDGGAAGAAISLYLKQGAQNWNFPLWCCTASDISVTTRGLVTFNSSLKSQGPYTKPA